MKFDCLVVAGGVKPSKKLARALIKKNPDIKVIAVDSGFDFLHSLKIPVDLFVGDGDSIKFRGKINARKTVWLPKDKSISDLEFALKSLPSKSKKAILAAHKEGERLDHSFVNQLLALKYKNLFFIDEKSWLTGLHGESFKFKARKKTFSVISPFKVRLSVKGARYNSATLVLKSPSHGLSNQTLAHGPTQIKVQGRAILFALTSFTSIC